jgi:predicted mannosyl-3-phosphoglycerate phosphatase (HAD superfamily)
MPRRTQTIYVTLDPFLSPRGKVLHRFDQFLAGLSEHEFPCIWLTSWTRAQLDEPRRRLGHNEPFIGESGSGVYLPEDYFHLKSGNTIRLGRFTCIPVAKPQPAAAEALEDLAADLNTSIVPLRTLSPRELYQNTGLPQSEAEQVRMRDFDELFFFAGAPDSEIARFSEEAKLRGLTLERSGAFWSLACGADYAKCIREVGGLYDRAIRAHALRVGVAVSATGDLSDAAGADPAISSLQAACDRTLLLAEKDPAADDEMEAGMDEDKAETDLRSSLAPRITPSNASAAHEARNRNAFHLHSPELWDEVLADILNRK